MEEHPEQKTLTRDVALLSEGFKSAAAASRWSDVNVVLSDGVYASHRLVLASARDDGLRNHSLVNLLLTCYDQVVL